jgi:hypothetical protein
MMHRFLIAVAVALAQSESTKPKLETGADKVQFERWQKYYRRVAAEYDMEQGKDLPCRLKLRPDSVLSYANPAGGGRSHGAMFVWTRDGRPEILGAIWSRQSGEQRYVIHEMHSLSLEPLTATRNGNLFWSPKGPGIKPFTDLPVSARHKDVQIWSFQESSAEGPMGGFDKGFYVVPGVDALPTTGPD